MQILEILARVQATETDAHFLDTIRQERVHLSWGTTVIVVTSHQSEELAKTLLLLKRSGLRVTLILVDPPRAHRRTQEESIEELELPVFKIRQDKDIEIWSPMV
jgi:hypothetical protein